MNWQTFFKSKYPILQATMTHNGSHELATEISRCGGVGVIMPNGGYSAQWFDEQISALKAKTNNPFSVAIFQRPWHAEKQFLGSLHSKTLTEDDKLTLSGIDRGRELAKKHLEICLDHKAPIVHLLGGAPEKAFVKRLQSAGCKVIGKVHSFQNLKGVAETGVDAIVIKGYDSAGYIGRQPIDQMLKESLRCGVPIISSGGISTSAQIKSHLKMGALAVQLGTRFVCAKESPAHINYKTEIFKSSSRQVMASHSDFDVGLKPTRALINNNTGTWIRDHNKILEKIYDKSLSLVEAQRQLKRLPCVSNPIAGWSEDLHRAIVKGDVTNGVVMIGKSIDEITEEETVENIFHSLLKELNLDQAF